MNETWTWTLVSLAAPPPHRKYIVGRNHQKFIATPCYGMHEPWWVPTTPTGESEPIKMEYTDRWAPVPPENS